MNADERNLITDLFERLRAYGQIDKDHDAEALIISHARNNPDAGYMLVQNILVQEQVMAQQGQQIEQLQARIQELESMQRGASQAPGQRSGGFLGGAASGGMFGGNRGASSVPTTSRPAPQPQAYNPAPQQPAPSPWGRTAPQQPQPQYQQPSPGYQQPQAAPAAGGGFMRSAFGMAAGVAGGMLAANAISNMMKGGASPTNEPASSSSSSDLGSNDPGNVDPNAGYGMTETASGGDNSYSDANNDPGNYTEEATDTSWDGGGDVEL
jgi:uncharacterized protein